ncbi:LytTR family DNA-binding domain-containing protein [Aquimarina sp. AD1]|uniref:LytR/AlgR family response regulator transcription factor n=3 Tax=Aquimarina sp. (strain AD1) TaxID=1714848 RepID=UPI000E4A6428|nr:response regulator transcription factor [Aquimarina sp. AD1]AXT57105.1 DNA-binding response regulator [Aquimarina sp. AD1]
MKKIRCIAIDDEPLALEVIQAHLKQIPDAELVASYTDPIEAFDKLKDSTIDLIFLDIEMPLLSGLDFVKSLKNPPKIIFTTAYRNYAIESYELLDVVDYLLKPISFMRFFKAINKYKALVNTVVIREEIKESAITNDHLYVNSNKKFIKINFEEILYIESIKDYVRIHLKDASIMTKDSITNFKLKLPDNFLRIHRSFIVNIIKVTAFTKVDVEIGDKEIPIGASYKEYVMSFLSSDQ